MVPRPSYSGFFVTKEVAPVSFLGCRTQAGKGSMAAVVIKAPTAVCKWQRAKVWLEAKQARLSIELVLEATSHSYSRLIQKLINYGILSTKREETMLYGRRS